MSSVTGAPDYPVRLNIAARLIEGALDSGWRDHPAFFYRDRELTYGDVYRQAAQFAGALEELGVAREQRVVVGLPDVPAFVGAFLGTMWYGAVAVPINPFLQF
jgi:acyl-CoA synthetase (AMP-forming)/AMP-acid ligase II